MSIHTRLLVAVVCPSDTSLTSNSPRLSLACLHEFTNSGIAQQNLLGFSNIWSALTSGDKLKGAFFYPVQSTDHEVRLAVWIDYYDTPETHCCLVIDGPFLGSASVDQIAELLDLTETFQGKLFAAGSPPAVNALNLSPTASSEFVREMEVGLTPQAHKRVPRTATVVEHLESVPSHIRRE
ncbi:hypothetical protein PQR53_05775 [Paraburkholderia fungorum]|uniref:hypothetical protein n=1 Tax=Paraburkholderia fungorum TaxID=134537 RepID=UPI0038B99476